MAVPIVAHADYSAIQSIERREQGSRTVALLVMRHRPTTTFLQRQSRLGPVQRLNLTLFVRRRRPVHARED